MTQSIIVFGGSGFIGQAVCKEAIKRNISVISISKHGKPKTDELWLSHHLITWLAIDIFQDDSWEKYLTPGVTCINLIGILFEQKKKGLTYDKMIVLSNHLISEKAEINQTPYIFLSAKAGPCGYIKAKKKAETELLKRKNPTIIIRSGLVTTKRRPFVYTQGMMIKTASHLPFVKRTAEKIYPTPLKTLVAVILNEAITPSFKIIEDIR
ncbi:NAD-dependent epimerase/dehydratase family protein [Vagococcus sp.]|uniref:NAD-dependent epimerase/dehydratase family protein n=1 Tax=Vagococcus sp. TaxID=1933889 RepID=UPI002FC77D0D